MNTLYCCLNVFHDISSVALNTDGCYNFKVVCIFHRSRFPLFLFSFELTFICILEAESSKLLQHSRYSIHDDEVSFTVSLWYPYIWLIVQEKTFPSCFNTGISDSENFANKINIKELSTQHGIWSGNTDRSFDYKTLVFQLQS